jgi:glutamine amidotransferase PdxT
MKENVTAEWARKTAETILGEKINKQIEQCLEAIETSVKRNEFSCSVSCYPDDLTLKELNKRGFKTKYMDGDWRDGGYLKISW